MKVGKRLLILMCRECEGNGVCAVCEVTDECNDMFHSETPIEVAEREQINWKVD